MTAWTDDNQRHDCAVSNQSITTSRAVHDSVEPQCLVSAERREADSGLCPQEQERQSRLEEALPLGSQVPQGEANGPEPESGRLSRFLDESRRAIVEAASSEAEGQHQPITFANLATPHTHRGTRTAFFRFSGVGRVGEGAPSQPVVGAPAIPQPRCAWAVGSPTFAPTHPTHKPTRTNTH